MSPADSRHPRIEAVYRDNYDLLYRVATGRFGIPADEAPTLVHDVILSFIGAAYEVNDPRRWLLAAICNASRYFQRVRHRVEWQELPDSDGNSAMGDHGLEGEALIGKLTATAILGELKQRHREILRLHYIEGLTAAEIATRLETTLGYAERLIHKSLKAANQAYSRLESRGTEEHGTSC